MKRIRRLIVARPISQPNTDQLPLLPPIVAAPESSDLTIQERFERFHATNPQVYGELRRLALDLVTRGHRRIGVKMLWESLRYRLMAQAVNPASADTYRLNNIYTSRYARMLGAEPQLSGLIEMRTLKAE